MRKGQITLRTIGGIFLLIISLVIILKAMSGDFEGAILDWANLQVPFWVGLPAGLIAIGVLIYILFKEQINNFINNFDLSGGRL